MARIDCTERKKTFTSDTLVMKVSKEQGIKVKHTRLMDIVKRQKRSISFTVVIGMAVTDVMMNLRLTDSTNTA